MSGSLAVRNLTSTLLFIKRVEQFEDPNTAQSKFIGYIFGSRNTTSAAPSAPKLGEHAESFQHHDLNITLPPFESYTIGQSESLKTDVNDLGVANITLRLTIEDARGSRYRVDTHPSYTQKSSQALTSLTSASSVTYTAIFHPSRPTAHLAIHTNHLLDYKKWMATLPDTLPLSSVSIPGTHNSHTYYHALPSVRCQINDIKTQLEQGIRFLDIRLQPVHATDTSKKDLYLVHGAFPISLTGPKYFTPILQTCYDFLAANPSETILVSLKREGVGSATDQHLAQILEEHYISPNATKWYLDSSLPYLGAVRGKIVLVRRYHTSSSISTFGLDATPWPHNASHALFPSSNPTFCLQDFCEVMVPATIPEKIGHINQHLVRAAACHHHIPGITTDKTNPVPPGPLYLNFLSASNFWNRKCWPENIAKTVNRGMEEWLCVGHGLEDPAAGTKHPEHVVDAETMGVRRKVDGDAGTGIVVMDCVGEGGDWDMVRLIIGMNMGVLMKVHSGM
jgi:1-phosphatidylinositol phosphodiesterase